MSPSTDQTQEHGMSGTATRDRLDALLLSVPVPEPRVSLKAEIMAAAARTPQDAPRPAASRTARARRTGTGRLLRWALVPAGGLSFASLLAFGVFLGVNMADTTAAQAADLMFSTLDFTLPGDTP